MNEIQWRKDELAIEILQDMELPHSTRHVSVRSEIDLAIHNKARQKKIDPELVDDYVFAMRSGDKFPNIVLGQIDGKPKLYVIGGNHRIAAVVKIGVQEIPAIVVQCSAAAAEMLAKRLNVSNGKREARETRVLMAMDLVQHHGQKVETAAKIAGVSPYVVNNALRTEKVRLRAMELGLPQSSELSIADGVAIGDLVNDSDLFPSLYELAIIRNVHAEKISAVCKDVRKANSLAEKKAIIEKAQAECKSGKKSKASMFPVATQIRRCVVTLKSQTTGRLTLLALQLTKQEAQQLLCELTAVVKDLETAIAKS